MQITPDGVGAFQNYHNGVIYWSEATGAHDLYGAILQKWNAEGGLNFGYPTTNENATPDGLGLDSHFAWSYPLFGGGSEGGVSAIDSTTAFGVDAVTGPIATLFASKGWEANGEASSDEIDLTVTGGSYQYFTQHISFGVFGINLPYAIDYTSKTGAYVESTTSQYSDIGQGINGTCWIDAAMAAMENEGHDLSQMIHYQGNGEYTVQLYVPKNAATRAASGYKPITVTVFFNGATNSADVKYSASEPSQSWVVVMQRAIIEAVETWDPSQSITNPHSGGVDDALATLTGNVATSVGANAFNVQQQVIAALAAHKNVALGSQGTATQLVQGHTYAVLSASSQGVVLYNPWGAAQTAPVPDPQLVSWSVIAKDGTYFFFD